jgi:HK97 family phage prohead protease
MATKREVFKGTRGVQIKATDRGEVSAAFSVFNVVDSDGDVVRPTAFRDGQQVPAVWAHDWGRPVGKGIVRVRPGHAEWQGRFFMDTRDGADAFRVVKNMGDLQQWSWGFNVLDSEPGDHNGQRVRFINRADVFEVSPVLVGANRLTHTLDVKQAIKRAPTLYDAPPGKYAWRTDRPKGDLPNTCQWWADQLTEVFATTPLTVRWLAPTPEKETPKFYRDGYTWTNVADFAAITLKSDPHSVYLKNRLTQFPGLPDAFSWFVSVAHETFHQLGLRGRAPSMDSALEEHHAWLFGQQAAYSALVATREGDIKKWPAVLFTRSVDRTMWQMCRNYSFGRAA